MSALRFTRINRFIRRATGKDNRVYEMKLECGRWLAYVFENEDTPYGDYFGDFPRQPDARAVLNHVHKEGLPGLRPSGAGLSDPPA